MSPKSTSGDTATSSNSDRIEVKACPICKGQGSVTLDVPIEHPDFGKVFPCECKLREFEQGRLDRLERYSNLGHLTRLTFDNLLPRGRSSDPQNQARFSHCYLLAKEFAQNPRGWLVLTGPSGCGKTHLAAAITNYRLHQGHLVFFAITPDLLDHLRATFSPESEVSYDELFERVRNVPFLVLDDLGTQSSTPWAEEKLFQILNHRYNAQLPTIITINNLEELDERLRTRLKDPGLARECELERRGLSAYQQIGGLSQEQIAKYTFDTFDPRGMNADEEQQENLRRVFAAARQFAERPENWLVLVGTYGCGKTHLAAAIANYQLQQGGACFFAVVPDLLDHLRSTFSPESKVTYDTVFERVKTSPLLILDDLGTEASTPWVQEKLYQLVNYRYNSRLPTVFTKSGLLEEIEGRLYSRLMDPKLSTVVPITAPSYRGPTKPAVEQPKHAPHRGRRR